MEMTKNYKIVGGLYLVLNPSMDKKLLIHRLRSALDGGVQLLQIWNNWPDDYDRDKKRIFAEEVTAISMDYSVPVLINGDWGLLLASALSGVDLHVIPADCSAIQGQLPGDATMGNTDGNDLQPVGWADEQR